MPKYILMLKTLDEIGDIEGKRILVRSALNVSMTGDTVSGEYRLQKALPTILFLMRKKARVILLSHRSDETGSLKGVYDYLKRTLPVSYVDDIVGNRAQRAVAELKIGEVLMLENVRWNKGEKTNDAEFAKALASLGDMYVNDDFPASHRNHASIVGIPKLLPPYAGRQFMAEYEHLQKALAPESPSLAIIGGAKFLTKEPLLRRLFEMYDQLFIGGALANDFFLAKGFEVGKSLVSRSPHIQDLLKNSKLILPEDVVVEGPDGVEVKLVGEVGTGDSILDVGPASIQKLELRLSKARSILWNGPLGNFENGFTDATEEIAKGIAKTSAISIVGGGDTVTAIDNLNLNDQFTFVSTAGGAMLDYISDGTLVGLDALKGD